MARGHQKQQVTSHWWSDPPLWAWIAFAVSVAILAVGMPLATARGQISEAERARIQAIELPPETAPEAAPEPVALPEAVDSVIAFGDSYTDRTTAGKEGTYVDQLADLMGWPEPEVWSTSGGGYQAPGSIGRFVELVPQAAAEAPDVVIVQGGRNDYKYAELAPSVVEVLRAVHDRWPDAVVVVPGILWPSPVPDAVAESNAEIMSAAASLDFTIPVDLIAGGFVYELGEDGIHPNAAGQQQLAEGMRAALAG